MAARTLKEEANMQYRRKNIEDSMKEIIDKGLNKYVMWDVVNVLNGRIKELEDAQGKEEDFVVAEEIRAGVKEMEEVFGGDEQPSWRSSTKSGD